MSNQDIHEAQAIFEWLETNGAHYYALFKAAKKNEKPCLVL